MKKRTKARGLKRMRDLGYKPVTANLKEAPHAAMKAWTSSQGISHSEYIAGLVADDLVKKGFLGRELAAQGGGDKKGRKKASKSKGR